MNLPILLAALFAFAVVHTVPAAPRMRGNERGPYVPLVRKRRQENHTVSGGFSASPGGKPEFTIRYDYNPNDNLNVFFGGSHTVGGGTNVGGGVRWIIPTKKNRKRPKEE
ncbi:uncharacterized protein LOC122251883 [Penaeus japonicus]|uniref:uncharacterized protein LOC122251883 n=1 Tax=Penaeus japonicus TaxID=27405 RepID=UPI001C714530|nr:uncharacterized protein LOC122251883 [Penaeus japonicus]